VPQANSYQYSRIIPYQMNVSIVFHAASAFGFLSIAASAAQLSIAVTDADGKTLPSRIHLAGFDGKPIRAGNLPFFQDHFVCDGQATVDLPPGPVTYEIERGPEYTPVRGRIEVGDGQANRIEGKLARIVDLSKQGWWSGETHIHRPVKDIELLMRAEDLHIGPVMTWWNDQNQWSNQALPTNALVQFDGNRYYHLMAGEDEREGGALLYFGLPKPLNIAGWQREYPSPMKFLNEAKTNPGSWVDIEKPFWWDVPIWLASGKVNSIGLANNHMNWSGMLENEAWGRPRDTNRLAAPRGNGWWTQEIYYHILNSGLRIPPSAGSASGVLPNPVGYNRVYVYCGDTLTWDKWWEGLGAGRSFVSNGPLLIAKVADQLPGYIFQSAARKSLDLPIKVQLWSKDTVKQIEVIRDGKVERTVAADAKGIEQNLGTIHFERSGWFLIRAVADEPKTFRFASTAPYYVEIGDSDRRISRESAQFFLDWAKERRARVKLDDAAKREEVLKFHDLAEQFWQERVNRANAE
jgi:hypothetical protein